MTVTKLQHLWQQLTSRTPGSESASTSGLTLVDAVDEGLGGRWKLWGLLTGKGGDAPAAESEHTVKGLYLYGGVGSGKTMLMDLFYDTLPPSVRKKRVRRRSRPPTTTANCASLTLGTRPQVHYHDFMLDVHRRLRELKAMEDPLRAVAEVRALLAACHFAVSDPRCSSATSRILCAPVAAALPRARLRCCAWMSSWSRTWRTP